jgi:3',5'-cyclic-AMP phosphodiesterase
MLLNTEDFFIAIKDYKNIRAVLYGHQHQEFQAQINDILYYSPPAASFQFSKDIKWAFDSKGPGFGIISITENREISTENIYLDIKINPIYTKVH